MKPKLMMVAALALALVAAAGCGQPAQQSRSLAPQASAALFGPTPLAPGQEDRGYFATTALAAEEPLLMFEDRRLSYVRTDIWDLEDNFRPFQSHRQMWRHSLDEGPANR